MKKILDYDPHTGMTEVFHGSEDGETFTIETIQDVSPVIEANKAAQNERFNKKSEMWHAATIPPSVQLKWLVEHGIDIHNKDHWQGVKRLLNSNEYSHLRPSTFTL